MSSLPFISLSFDILCQAWQSRRSFFSSTKVGEGGKKQRGRLSKAEPALERE